MKDIRVRVWDTKTKKMSHGMNLPQLAGYIAGIYPRLGNEVYLESLGHIDKNGREIFDGDIVKLPQRYSGDNHYKESVAEVVWDHDGWYVEKQGECDYKWFEVIGNKYENPELLK